MTYHGMYTLYPFAAGAQANVTKAARNALEAKDQTRWASNFALHLWPAGEKLLVWLLPLSACQHFFLLFQHHHPWAQPLQQKQIRSCKMGSNYSDLRWLQPKLVNYFRNYTKLTTRKSGDFVILYYLTTMFHFSSLIQHTWMERLEHYHLEVQKLLCRTLRYQFSLTWCSQDERSQT